VYLLLVYEAKRSAEVFPNRVQLPQAADRAAQAVTVNTHHHDIVDASSAFIQMNFSQTTQTAGLEDHC
jgi:hypothetical protein